MEGGIEQPEYLYKDNLTPQHVSYLMFRSTLKNKPYHDQHDNVNISTVYMIKVFKISSTLPEIDVKCGFKCISYKPQSLGHLFTIGF